MGNGDNWDLSFYVREPEADSLDQTSKGIFCGPPPKAYLRLDEALERAQSSSKTYEAYLKKLDKLIEKHPDFLESYNEAGNAYLELASKVDSTIFGIYLDSAQAYYQRGYDRAHALIPDNFKGRIVWQSLDNRPFLRIHHGLILCYLRRREYAQAVTLMKEHLAWNPEDNLGICHLIGDAYFLKGDIFEARKFLSAAALQEGYVPYPPGAYTLGLLEFKEGNYSAASTALRIGFVTNPYIAEMLTGRSVEKPHFYWHGSSWAGVTIAEDYLIAQDMLPPWRSVHQAIDFLDWLYNCAAVMKERLEWTEIREGLTYQHELTARVPFSCRENALIQRIRKVSMFIHKVSRRGETLWPWEHSRTDLMF